LRKLWYTLRKLLMPVEPKPIATKPKSGLWDGTGLSLLALGLPGGLADKRSSVPDS
jgi:hypothetical protein